MLHGFEKALKRYLYLALSLPQLQALAGALEVNKTLRILTVAAWESTALLETVAEMKRGRGEDFRFISRGEQEAEKCWGLRSQ